MLRRRLGPMFEKYHWNEVPKYVTFLTDFVNELNDEDLVYCLKVDMPDLEDFVLERYGFFKDPNVDQTV